MSKRKSTLEMIDELQDRIKEEAKEEWKEEALSEICGVYERDSWSFKDMKPAFDKIAKILDGEDAAKVFILYLAGWMLATGRARAYYMDTEDTTLIKTIVKPSDEYIIEDQEVWIGDLKLEGVSKK